MDAWRNKWALVTGASAGIGQALAEELSAGGANLVITARRADRLENLRQRLTAQHNVKIEIAPADLTDAAAPTAIHAFTQARGIQIDFLINNAGFGAYGEFHASDPAPQLDMVKVNCLAVVDLTHLYLPAMIERRSGDILIVASTAAFQPVAYIATYAATKAFDLLFAEAIAEETERYGIRVCALCPGPTESEFRDVAGTPPRGVAVPETAAKVARVGLEALLAGKHSVVSGLKNQLSIQFQRLAPRRLVSGAAASIFRPEHLKKT